MFDPSYGNRDVMTTEHDSIKLLLASLADELHRCDEPRFAAGVEAAASGSSEQRSDYLKSNELWGGPGSIADQAGLRAERGSNRKRLELVLRDLGLEQIRQGIVNPRTSMWVEAFQKWNEMDN
jgi:hypothetical protein